jgi:hypothetical protein
MNALREIKVTSELQPLLAHFAEIGGVIDYVVMRADEENVIPDNLHQNAAILFMQIMKERTEKYFAELALSHPQYVGQNLFQIEFEPSKAVRRQISLDEFIEGYRYAFSEPPYSLRESKQEVNELFIGVNQALFDRFEAPLEIYEWSNDWSTYFDPGNEWWGAFLWTVWNEKKNWVIGIGASATD